MTSFAFRSPQILFGNGERRRAAGLAARFGGKVLLVTGASSLERSGALGELTDSLDALGVEVTRWAVPGEPDIDLVDSGAAACREAGCGVVLAVGGGSVLDTGKAIAAMATNPGEVLDYLEEVGTGQTVDTAPLPVIAVPTTAGSGSEVTRNSVIRVPAASVKRSLRSDQLLPRVAVVDPELSSTAPAPVAAAAGLDALTHLIESYVCLKAQPMTDAYALPGIRLAAAGLHGLAGGGGTAQQRSLASLWGGICLANAGLGAVHGLAAPLGGTACIAHGVACACLLPATIRVNVEALRSRAPESPALDRYDEVFRVVNPSDPTADGTAAALDDLRRGLGVPALSVAGLRAGELKGVVAGSRGGSMRANPIALTDAELESILHAAL
ncbi:MAG TPA: iron-containing alcohol dehydrogenase [Actinomycetota bacterium]|nr:iron-containing alcohol dehydrogenase [Actinomycetota bacterium]